MKKILVIVAALALVQNWGAIQRWWNPPPDYSQQHDAEVVLYATSWCGYCAKARKFLNDNEIAFVEYDIEKSEEGRQQHQSLIDGNLVPVLVVNGEVVKGFNKRRLKELLL